MRICITLMYDGTDYCGWQLQPNKVSVQGEVTEAIYRLTGERVSLRASGRTDAGVHALCQVADFELNGGFDVAKLVKGINFYLPESIRVIKAVRTSDNFNARFDCKRKTYIYKMYISAYDNPLLINRALRLESGIDVQIMKRAALLFEGTHDFKGFMSNGSSVKTTVRTVYSCKVIKRGREVTLRISANGFLYNMVRRITAVIIAAGQGKISIDNIASFLHLREPQKAIVPPHGLYLFKVSY